jgi:hypothetical protein
MQGVEVRQLQHEFLAAMQIRNNSLAVTFVLEMRE